MKFKRHGNAGAPAEVQIELAPMIDIVFQLLIFFLLTSSFITLPQTGIQLKLPKASTGESLHELYLTFVVTGDNVLYLQEAGARRVVTLPELDRHLARAAEEDRPVLIQADRQASMGRVVEVWDHCRAAGVTKVNVATTPRSK